MLSETNKEVHLLVNVEHLYQDAQWNDREVLLCFMYIKEKTLGEDERGSIWIMEKGAYSDENKYICKVIVKLEELNFKS